MNRNAFSPITPKLLLISAFLCNIAPLAMAQTTDEQTIRNLVEQQMQNPDQRIIPHTDERVFWSGPFPRPLVGGQQTPDSKQISERMNAERLNYRTTVHIERLVVAQSGDVAYEYSTGTISWDTPEKKHIDVDNAYLRAWRKVNNVWKEDAFFARPLDSSMTAYKK